MQVQTSGSTIIALDVGERRIGVARASTIARLPGPYKTLERNEQIIAEISKMLDDEDAGVLVVGLPRGLSGQHTAQTTAVENFVEELKKTLAVPIYWQDEALTSRKAEAELEARGRPYKKADVDALSATYILEDYLRDNPVEEG